MVSGGRWFHLTLLMLTRYQVLLSAMSRPQHQQWPQYYLNYTDTSDDNSLCRTRSGLQNVSDYTISTCVGCYQFLFQRNFVSEVLPRTDDQNAADSVCETLTKTDCGRWKTCCRDAMKCCESQRKSSEKQDGGHCPMTWDGYSCVEATPSGKVAQIICPSFMAKSRPEDRAYKKCTPNGTWWREPEYNNEWTNYSSCVDIDLQGERAAQIVAISCNGLSILLLVPAIAIFVGFRQLRYHRHVKLHINLSVSLLLTSLTSLLMEKLVYYDGLFIEGEAEPFQVTHETGCKVLNILDLLFQMCPAFWMLCEGFYLSWLMLRAFQPLKHMVGFYIFGWGVPVLIIIIYTILQSQLENSVCWLKDSKGLQWVVYAPTIACIAANLVLFLVILKVLLTQIQSHPREPNNFRRVMKATVILIPLFGLQQFCIIYSPSSTVPGFVVYNIAREIIIHSQGLLVAIIFCFCNTEVHNQISLGLKQWRQDSIQNSRRSLATVSTSSLASQRSSLPDVHGAVLQSINGSTGGSISGSGETVDPNNVNITTRVEDEDIF